MYPIVVIHGYDLNFAQDTTAIVAGCVVIVRQEFVYELVRRVQFKEQISNLMLHFLVMLCFDSESYSQLKGKRSARVVSVNENQVLKVFAVHTYRVKTVSQLIHLKQV